MAMLTFRHAQYRIFNTLYIAASLDQFLGRKAAAWSHGHDGRMTCRRSLTVGAQHNHVIWRDFVELSMYKFSAMSFDTKRKNSGRDFLFSVLWHLSCTIRPCTIRSHYISVLRQCGGRRTLVVVFGDFVSSFLSMFLDFPGEFCFTVPSVSSCVEGMHLVCISTVPSLVCFHWHFVVWTWARYGWVDDRKQSPRKLVNGFAQALGHAASLLQWPRPGRNTNMTDITCWEHYMSMIKKHQQAIFLASKKNTELEDTWRSEIYSCQCYMQ